MVAPGAGFAVGLESEAVKTLKCGISPWEGCRIPIQAHHNRFCGTLFMALDTNHPLKEHDLPREQVDDLLAGAASDPALFGASFLGGSYTPDQLRVMAAVRDHERVAVHSGHATGKSFVAAAIVLWFLHSHKPSKVVTTAPTWRQVNEILWSEIRIACERSTLPLGSHLPPRAPELRVGSDHFAVGISTDDSARFQGFHSENLLIVLDEAGGIGPEIWDAVEYIASGGAVKVLAIGNPDSPDGRFISAVKSPLWHSINISCMTHPNITGVGDYVHGAVTKDWVEGRKLEWGEDSPLYQARVCGKFPEEGDDTLISLRWVIDAVGRKDIQVKKPPVIGVDVARFGSDETVLMLLRDELVVETRAYIGRDLMQTCGEILRMKRDHGLDETALVVVDDVGLGGGVTDRLREQGQHVMAFKGGAKARDSNQFLNRRAEAWWFLREELREGRLCLPDDDLLKSQLSSVRYNPRSDGKIQLEKKDQMLKRGVPSPDRADALVMAVWGRKRVGSGLHLSPGNKPRTIEADPFDQASGLPGTGSGLAEWMGVTGSDLNML